MACDSRSQALRGAITGSPQIDLLELDDALMRLTAAEPVKGELVTLRFFGGLTMAEAARVLGVSLATAERHWTFAKSWLFAELSDDPPELSAKKSSS